MEEEAGGNSAARRLHRHHPAGGVSSNGLTLSLPLPPPATGEPPSNGVDRHGRDDIWSPGATDTLVNAWGDRYLQLNRGNLKQKHWKEVSDAVNRRGGPDSVPKPTKTDVQCKNRLDTLKKKYKVEKGRIFAGCTSKWALFAKMDQLIGPSRKQHHQHEHYQDHHHYRQAGSAMPVRQKRPAESSPDLTPVLNDNNNNRINNNNNNNNNMAAKESPDMTESCPNGFDNNNNNIGVNVNGNACKRGKARDNEGGGGHPFRELAGAILKFGEIYERVEGLKQQQMMDLEKQRMEFTKDLELQRMQLFMRTQLELAKIKHGKHGNTEHYL